MNDWYCSLTYPSEEYLSHYGILGMKWGVRRYQNSDGTYNAAGRARYGIGDGRTYSGINKSSTTNQKQTKSVTTKSKSTFSTSTSEENSSSEKKGLTRNQKIAIGVGIGAAVVGTGVALHMTGADKKIADAGKQAIDSILGETKSQGNYHDKPVANKKSDLSKENGKKKLSDVLNSDKYYGYKKDTKNIIVGSEDAPLYRVQINNNKLNNPNDPVYSTYSPNNNDFYKKWMYDNRGRSRGSSGDTSKDAVYNLKITYNNGEGVKKATDDQARAIYNGMRKNNPEFRQALKEMPDSVSKSKKLGKRLSTGYDRFNINLGSHGRDSKAGQMYFSEMSKRGYHAITDLNDAKYNHKKGKPGLNAVITFNTEARVESERVMGDEVDRITKSLRSGRR